MRTVEGLDLAALKKVVVVKTKHVERLFQMQVNEFEYDQQLLEQKNQVARPNCHIPYSIGIGGSHRDDVSYLVLDLHGMRYADVRHAQNEDAPFG